MSGIAGRYGAAMFELAREAGALDAVAADLDRLRELVAANPDLARLVRSPAIGRGEQGRAMAAVMEHLGISGLVQKLVGVLAANRRLSALAGVAGVFRAMLARERGETTAELISAAPLPAAQVQSIKSALTRAAGRDVIMLTRVEPELIGGVVVRMGSRMYDASLKGKLDRLRVVMKGVG
jgi:F-type H+-transporting ATPase subunit delta